MSDSQCHPNRSPRLIVGAALAAAMAALAGCTAIENFAGGDRVDYRTAPTKTVPLDVPPDLTQLSRDSRFQTQGGSVSAAAFQAATPASPRTATVAAMVAPQALGSVRLERDGTRRWLSTTLSPEQLWPQLQAFWKDAGLTLVVDEPAAGLMETAWGENRAKLPDDVIRRTFGRLVEALYSTGERDKFNTRLERSATGTEIYVSHRGLVEVVVGGRQNETTAWQRRPSDPELENAMLARMMVKLGLKEEQAKAAVADTSTASAPARARVLDGRAAATLQVDDNFERAWRRVGLALDRSGFTVEDRDRTQGLYFVRYIDPAVAGQEEPGFFAKLFGAEKGDTGPKKYRISVKGEGGASLVSVLNATGGPDSGDAGPRIIKLLVEDLK